MKEDPFNGDTYLAQEFLRLRDAFGVTEVIETGTYHGVTTKWLAVHFQHVQTIEIKNQNFQIATRVLAKFKNVKCWRGSSAKLLTPALARAVSESTQLIVFLDAHWYTNPVTTELEQIKSSGKRPILVIHDFKNPQRPEYGYDCYPQQDITYEWEWIAESVRKIYGRGKFTAYYNDKATGAKRGCLFVLPLAARRTQSLISVARSYCRADNSVEVAVKVRN